MTRRVSRRAFMAGVAGVGTALTSGVNLMAQGKTPLTMFFGGLAFFQHDKATGEMRVGLLGAGHETIIVARKVDVDKPGTDLTGNQYQRWNPTDLGVISMNELTYWRGNRVSFSLNSTDALSAQSPLGVFPLTRLATQRPTLTSSNCQSILTFKNGAFAGKRRTSSCGHDTTDWSMVTSLADPAPHMSNVRLLDTVQYNTSVSSGGFAVNGSTVNFKPKEVKLWLLQFDATGATGQNPREIVHCQHYYDLVPGYNEPRYYPRRGPVPASCERQVDADPIYCTPGE